MCRKGAWFEPAAQVTHGSFPEGRAFFISFAICLSDNAYLERASLCFFPDRLLSPYFHPAHIIPEFSVFHGSAALKSFKPEHHRHHFFPLKVGARHAQIKAESVAVSQLFIRSQNQMSVIIKTMQKKAVVCKPLVRCRQKMEIPQLDG